MKNGHIEKSDAEALMGMYHKFDIHGNTKEPLTAKEMVLILGLAKAIEERTIYPEWIPCDVALPKKGETALCYHKYEPESPDVICENIYQGKYYGNAMPTGLGNALWLSEEEKVVAWMPLPPRYEEKEKH